MDVDGLEVDVNVEGLEDGEGRGLLCGADGPGGDMKEEEDEEEVRLMFSARWRELAKMSRERFSIGIFRPSKGREHSEHTCGRFKIRTPLLVQFQFQDIFSSLKDLPLYS